MAYNYGDGYAPGQSPEELARAAAQKAYTEKQFMPRDAFLAKYAIGPGGTFLANDRGGNAASEVAGRNVAEYYDAFLDPNHKATGGYIGSGDDFNFDPSAAGPIADWGNGYRYRDQNPYFDAWDNVKPHPESQDLGGLGETWRTLGRPAATAAAMYFGVNALGGLLGAGEAGAAAAGSGASVGPAASAGGTAPFSFGTPAQIATGIDLGAVPTVAGGGSLGAMGGAGATGGASAMGSAAGNMTLAEQMASYGAGGGGITGGLSTGTVGGFTGAAGGDLVGSAASKGLLGDVGSWLKENPTLTQLGGAALGALSAKDQNQSSTTTKDPWLPAQQYLKDNLATNARMQDFYARNPFSTEQKGAYQGLLNTLANNQANGNVLLGNASKFGQSSRGQVPQMAGLLTGTQAPIIDWAKYANIGLLGG